MELNHKLEQIDSLKAELDALGPLDSDAKERLAQKVRMEWNFHSNVIEGNELTYGETRSLLISGITANGKSLKDHLDMKGHNEALKKLEQMADREVKITEKLMQEFHEIVLVDPYKDNPHVLVGKYKRTSNYLYNDQGERVDFVPVGDVPRELNELINWTNNAIFLPKRKKAKYETHPLLIATIFHMRFINIHPFDDGNGRICRIMMNIILLQCGFPPIIIQNEKRQAYFRAIQRSREEKDDSILSDFLADELIRSLELYLKAAKGEAIEEHDDLDKRIAMLNMKLEGVEDEVNDRTQASVRRVMHESIWPIIIDIDRKIQGIKQWFMSYLIEDNSRSYEIIDELRPDNLMPDLGRGKYHVRVCFSLTGFRKQPDRNFFTHTDLNIQFEKDAYQIILREASKVVKHTYANPLRPEERNEIVHFCINLMLKDINRLTGPEE